MIEELEKENECIRAQNEEIWGKLSKLKQQLICICTEKKSEASI